MDSAKITPKNLAITSMDDAIREWIDDFVSRPNPLLNNFPPCPFAKKAMMDNRVAVYKFKNWDNISYVAADWDDSLDVAIWWFPADLPTEPMVKTKLQFNDVWSQHDMWLLMDHPAIHETVSGVDMNFGPAGLLLLQKLSKLNEASRHLQRQGYYDSWSKEDQEFVKNRTRRWDL